MNIIIIISTATALVNFLCVTYKQNNWLIIHESGNGSLLNDFFFFFLMTGIYFGTRVEYHLVIFFTADSVPRICRESLDEERKAVSNS